MSGKKQGVMYRSYNWINKNPAIDAARTVVQDSGLSFKEIYEEGGATPATLNRWFNKDGTRCMFDSLMATMRAAGGDITFTSPKGNQIKVVVNKSTKRK